MRAIVRGLAVVCVLVVAAGALAAPREREPRGGGVIAKVVKKLRALGDLLTIPGAAPQP